MSKRLILQVEDNPNDIQLLQIAFETRQCETALQAVKDGAEAIDYLSGAGKYANRQQFPLPTLVLLDIKMPRVSGMEVLEWIRHQPSLRLLTVVLFSSSFHAQDVRQAYELGANCFLSKPIDMDGLREIAEFLDDWVRRAMFPSLG